MFWRAIQIYKSQNCILWLYIILKVPKIVFLQESFHNKCLSKAFFMISTRVSSYYDLKMYVIIEPTNHNHIDISQAFYLVNEK